jgi:ATP-dependent HslUV protease ATP-binding subunit HslU
VGKTEIARRLARLANAPFIKVEATKFTEVGYVGRDVDTIVRDLLDAAIKMVREQAKRRHAQRALDAAEDRILDVLVPPARPRAAGFGFGEAAPTVERDEPESAARQKFRKRLREGDLDDREIEIELTAGAASPDIVTPPGMEEFAQQIQGLFANMGAGRRRTRRLRIADAMRQLADEEAARLVDEDEIRAQALAAVEGNGIVFIDEIDKIATRSETQGPDVSRQGVQRDLLPLVEGTTVSTRHGAVRTDHILFIASGAFHLAKPSDLIPELQGRLPIRVELDSLSVDDFERILTGTDNCLTRQYEALLATEAVTLEFTPEGVRRIAEIAAQVNENTENIGARRLHTVMERLLEDVSFNATRLAGQVLRIDAAYVEQRLADVARREDLARYVL